MGFKNGDKASELEVIGTCGKRNTGTTLRFLPNPKYFDSPKFSVSRLRHLLRAKAVLCPGLTVTFTDEKTEEVDTWYYEDGLKDYLSGATHGWETLPEQPFVGEFTGRSEAVSWAVHWQPEGGELVQESYVNLIPTARGGTHANGLRTGLLDALRACCARRSLLPRGTKLASCDISRTRRSVLAADLSD